MSTRATASTYSTRATASTYWAHAVGVALIGGLLGVEHWLVRPGDLSKLGKAFFDVNGYISLAYLGCTLVDVLVG